jgi:hypothetical protein
MLGRQGIAWAPENCLRLRPALPITPITVPSSASLNTRPGHVLSPRNITAFWFGGIHSEFGAPIPCELPRRGVAPFTARVLKSGATSTVHCRRKFLSVSTTCTRRLPRSPT